MKRTMIFLAVMFFTVSAVFAGGHADRDPKKAVSRLKEFKAQESRNKAAAVEKMKQAEKYGQQEKQNIDMLHYDLDLFVDPSQRFISGTVTLTFSPPRPCRRSISGFTRSWNSSRYPSTMPQREATRGLRTT